MYDVILADPPWLFKVWNDETGHSRSAEKHYHTMTIDDICALPVAELANENCALFLWCVWPSIFEYPQKVIDAWGFRYATKAFTWVKSRKNNVGFAMGMGYYTRANDEPCLLAIKGRMSVRDKGVLSIIHAPRRKHSQKPDAQYGKIERLYPNMRYLELFARKKREGWDSWGNEVENDIEILA